MSSKHVAAAVVQDADGRFLIAGDPSGDGYSFPVGDFEPDGHESPERTAVKAIEDVLGGALPGAAAEPIGTLRWRGLERNAKPTEVRFHAYRIALPATHGLTGVPDARGRRPLWLKYEEIVPRNGGEPSVELTPATPLLAEEIVEKRPVAVAVVTRAGLREKEYLVVEDPVRKGLMMPCKRITTESGAETAVRKIFTHDFGYRGDVTSFGVPVEPFSQDSSRYGLPALFRFELQRVSLGDADLNLPFGPLERSLAARGIVWRWVTADELLTPKTPLTETLRQLCPTLLERFPTELSPQRPISRGAIARIAESTEGESRWLAIWNEKWSASFFVGGHVENGETSRQALFREIHEELGLNGDDFVASTAPSRRLHYVADSKRTGKTTEYYQDLFDVTLKPAARSKVASVEKVRWLSEREIRRLASDSGPAISETVLSFLHQTGQIA